MQSWDDNFQSTNKSNTYAYYLHHFILFYCSIAINIIHRECPVELVADFARWCDIDCQQKLFKVNCSTVIRVECAKHMLAKLFSVTTGEKLWIHLEEFLPAKLSSRAISLQEWISRSINNLNQQQSASLNLSARKWELAYQIKYKSLILFRYSFR